MSNDLMTGLSSQQLRRAAEIKEKIEVHEKELRQLLNFLAPAPLAASAPGTGKQVSRSAAARAKMSAAAKAMWAKRRGQAAPAPAVKSRRRLSPEGRARIIAGTKARWARIRAAGRK